tara:strand:+ start:541 stop:975 length:435 start_codon:yes stop_codon:yes gene_type:complete
MDKEIREILKKGIPKYKQHGQYQMTLGSLIKALNKERTGLPVILSSVYHGYNDQYPGTPHSYYGYPSDLAFTSTNTLIIVADFLKVCESIIDSSFKNYVMKSNTPIWISEIDTASKTGIVDVISNVNHITLLTQEIQEEEIKDA